MTSLHILEKDMAALVRAAVHSARAGDWAAVGHYEQTRQQLCSQMAESAADPLLRPDVIDALGRIRALADQIEAAIADGRAAQDRAGAEACHSARASRAYVSVRTA